MNKLKQTILTVGLTLLCASANAKGLFPYIYSTLHCQNENGQISLEKNQGPRGTDITTIELNDEKQIEFFSKNSLVSESQGGCYVSVTETISLSNPFNKTSGELKVSTSYGMDGTRCVGSFQPIFMTLKLETPQGSFSETMLCKRSLIFK